MGVKVRSQKQLVGLLFEHNLGSNKPTKYVDSSFLLMKFISFSESICNSWELTLIHSQDGYISEGTLKKQNL